METAAPGPELADYAAMLRRRWWIVVVGVVVGTALAAAVLLVAPRSYTSSTAVQVRPTGLSDLTGERSGRTNGEVNLDTEAQVVTSAEVAGGAVQGFGTTADAEEAREQVDVTVPPNSSVLEISYSDSTPALAKAGSAAFADAYLDYRAREVGNQVDGRVKALRAELDGRYDELGTLSKRSAGAAGSAQVRAETQLGSVQQEISDLNSQINPLNAMKESLVPGQVITAATLPDSPSSPIPALWLGSGALLGLMLGLTAAYLRDRSDPRIHTLRELRRCVDTPVLLDLSEEGHATGDVDLLPSSSRAGQGFHELAHALLARMGEGDHVLLVSGIAPGRSGAVVAANLAAAMTRIDVDVLLVCADMDDTAAAETLGLPEGPGLADALSGGADPARMEYRPAAVPGLRVLRQGRRRAVAGEMIQRDVMGGLVRTLRGTARFVLVATAPTSERADAHAIAASADAVLAVVELGRTYAAELSSGIRQLGNVGIDVLGAVTMPVQGRAERAAAAPPAVPSPTTGGDSAVPDDAALTAQR